MATAPPSSFQMSSADLIRKEPLDYGGFGDVYLCYHVTLGQVVLKTLFTGILRNEDSKRSLLAEGNIMASLNHERVVKLLGVIMEDRDCSLVMELIPRGNLLVMLQKVSVPVSIKGRIILEILEGMVYLTDKRVIHKDIKPDNILVDKDFHIKIADMGLATCQTWSKLTKEEIRRRSRISQSAGTRGAGTLSYMAPEHLESINTASSEKSDVYSFAIVVWVILTGEEPYANARSEDHISQCVRQGDRPSGDLIPEDTPAEIIQFMKDCWNHNPSRRPTFKEGHSFFLPFYEEKLEPHIEEDLLQLRTLYEGPDDLVEKLRMCSLNTEYFSADGPAPLVSSDKSVPVEASIEDMRDIQSEPSVGSFQSDARGNNTPSALDDKLQRELLYHKHGSYSCESQPEPVSSFHRNSSNPFLPYNRSTSERVAMQPEEDKPPGSSVHSWTKAELEQSSSQEPWCRPTSGLYQSMNSSESTAPSFPMSTSSPSLDQLNQQQPHSNFNRQKSWPVTDTSAPGLLMPPEQGSIFINNARGIQIGNSNVLMIRSCEQPDSSLPASTGSSIGSLIREGIQKYDDHPVTEEHLDLLRANIGSKWKTIARQLGLTSVEIESIEHLHSRDGLPEIVHQMLEHWRMKEGSLGCRFGRLCQAMSGNISLDVVQKMLDICSSSYSMS
ncbi:receptor-interacting serine/threonine-protein kinase 1 [Limanda limanda]|uniref:receptor-interacting serine/threonine-protein kinase 1 n=1 Tax=Limanda limanda TaxID=27771 RepID=UPI0029C6552A|nr:receptor-interacting serine/threonine-protein kinase 1 [Limanda limanda]